VDTITRPFGYTRKTAGTDTGRVGAGNGIAVFDSIRPVPGQRENAWPDPSQTTAGRTGDKYSSLCEVWVIGDYLCMLTVRNRVGRLSTHRGI